MIEIDKLAFEYYVKDDIKPESITQKPPDGCYIFGMYLEGCKWDLEKHELNDSDPKEAIRRHACHVPDS